MFRNIKAEIIRLLKEDEEFRYTVAGLLGYREILEKIDANTEAIRSLQEQVAELQREVHALQEQVARLQEQVAELQAQTNRFARALEALGARWGVMAEESFRNGVRGIVEDLFGGKVERWEYYDAEGEVYGHPSMVEADLVIKDGKHFLVEVKSSVSKGDVLELLRIAKVYEKVTGVKPVLAIVSPFVDKKALKFSKTVGIRVYTTLE